MSCHSPTWPCDQSPWSADPSYACHSQIPWGEDLCRKLHWTAELHHPRHLQTCLPAASQGRKSIIITFNHKQVKGTGEGYRWRVEECHKSLLPSAQMITLLSITIIKLLTSLCSCNCLQKSLNIHNTTSLKYIALHVSIEEKYIVKS